MAIRRVNIHYSKNNFERAAEDSFSLTKCKNVGDLTHVTVGHDGAYLSPSWHVAQVEVFNLATGQTVIFPGDCWVSKNEAPHYSDEVMLRPAGEDDAALCSYQVTVKTSDVRFSGTDANVSCRIFGSGKDGKEERSTGEKKLENSKNNFER